MTRRAILLFVGCLLGVGLVGCAPPGRTGPGTSGEDEDRAAASGPDRIRPSDEYPAYWAYGGRPVLLLGGSREDNLFQIADLEAHLDTLAAAGGNYVRSTMSSRDEGNRWPFARAADGRYDLARPDSVYWDRFDRFLSLTAERDVVVQLEVWATFDFYDGRDRSYPRNWSANPFNPKNNVNYTAEASGLPEVVASHPTQTENPFFFTVPEEQNNTVVLPFQEAFVDELLRHTLPYGHVLYTMDNETSVPPTWGWHWARTIRNRAAEAGVTVETTEMWDPWDLAHPMHGHTFDRPDLYTFVDVSQNNHQTGQAHWDNAQRQRARVAASGQVRPLNNVKIYGADGGRFGSTRDGLERFWRNVFGGMASARFHRPDSGIGLNATARAHLRSARMLEEAIDVFRAEPTLDVLGERAENEAYAMAIAGEATAVFFPDGGAVTLAVEATESVQIRWLNLSESRWSEPSATRPVDGRVWLEAPGSGFWTVVVRGA